MNTTRQLLAAVKARHQLTSDYQLAKFLGLSKQRISANQAGAVMTDEAAIKVADALAMDRAHVLALVAVERAKDEAVKKAWQKAAAATAAAILAGLALVQIAPGADEGIYLTISALGNALAFDTRYTLYAAAAAALILSLAARIYRAQGENNDNNRPMA